MQLHFQSYGTGFPLIILHGLFGSLDNWQTVSRRLGGSFQVFALDLRNHGRSPHSDEFNYHVMAEDLHEFLQTHAMEKIHLMGHSLGGKAAMEFALQYPGLVDKLIVVDIAPKSYPPAHLPIFNALLPLDLTVFRDRSEISDHLAPSIPDLPTRQFLLKSLDRDDAGNFRWRLNLPAIHHNYTQLNQEIKIGREFTDPALFIKGGRSDYILEDDMKSIRHLFPQADLVSIANAGHSVHTDALEEFVAIVQTFLG